LAAIFLGVAGGGYFSLRLGYMRALILSGVLQALGIAAFAALAWLTPSVTLFSAVMAFDDFAISAAAVTLVAYMSSLTSLGYTATQYALLSSAYALAGKFLKGFSGVVVEGLTAQVGLMNAYAFFFIGCGAIGIPALLLFAALERRHTKAAINPT
jgi:PAT family beta-lactamase induction signal transducer AmpG